MAIFVLLPKTAAHFSSVVFHAISPIKLDRFFFIRNYKLPFSFLLVFFHCIWIPTGGSKPHCLENGFQFPGWGLPQLHFLIEPHTIWVFSRCAYLAVSFPFSFALLPHFEVAFSWTQPVTVTTITCVSAMRRIPGHCLCF